MRVLLTEAYTEKTVLLEATGVDYNRIDLTLKLYCGSTEFAIDGIAEPFALAAIRELYETGMTNLTYFEAAHQQQAEK